jgi:hypothetical protein
VARLRSSYNHHALTEGLAYATYYEGLFNDLRIGLTAAVDQARAANRGIYAIDATNSGIDASSLRVLTEERAIMPKLFRRLLEYMVNYGTAVGSRRSSSSRTNRSLTCRPPTSRILTRSSTRWTAAIRSG